MAFIAQILINLTTAQRQGVSPKPNFIQIVQETRKVRRKFIYALKWSMTDVWLTVHRNSVWIRNQLDVTFVLSFISPLQVAQHVSGNHVPIFRS